MTIDTARPRQEEMPQQPIRELHWELLTNDKAGNALWGQHHQQRDCDLCLHSSVVSNISSTLASHFRDAQKVCHHNFLFISAVIIDLESSPRPSPCLTWPLCRWGWGWSSHSSCHQWAHWSRQTPWPPPSHSTPGVSGWCSCSPGWLLSSPNAEHHQSKKDQFYFRGLKTLNILPISQKLWVRLFLQSPLPCTEQSSPETIWAVRHYFFMIHNFSLMWYNCGWWLSHLTRQMDSLAPPTQPTRPEKNRLKPSVITE